jgi:hypothetical protein
MSWTRRALGVFLGKRVWILVAACPRMILSAAGMTKAVKRMFANFCGNKRLDDSALYAEKYAVCRRPQPDFHALCIGIVSLLSFVHFAFNFHNCA